VWHGATAHETQHEVCVARYHCQRDPTWSLCGTVPQSTRPNMKFVWHGATAHEIQRRLWDMVQQPTRLNVKFVGHGATAHETQHEVGVARYQRPQDPTWRFVHTSANWMCDREDPNSLTIVWNFILWSSVNSTPPPTTLPQPDGLKPPCVKSILTFVEGSFGPTEGSIPITRYGFKKGVEVWLHSFLTSAPDKGEWLISRPGRFTPGKQYKAALAPEPTYCSYQDSKAGPSSP
jgi:hypothetical protein